MSQGVRWQVCKPCLQWCNTLGESSLIPPTSSASWDWTPVSNRMRRSSPSCSSPYSRTRSCTRAAWWSRRWSRTSSGASTPMSPSVQTARENLWVRHGIDFMIVFWKSQVRPTHFYELDLALATGSSSNKTVADCLKDFTKIEQMTGDERLDIMHWILNLPIHNCTTCTRSMPMLLR